MPALGHKTSRKIQKETEVNNKNEEEFRKCDVGQEAETIQAVIRSLC